METEEASTSTTEPSSSETTATDVPTVPVSGGTVDVVTVDPEPAAATTAVTAVAQVSAAKAAPVTLFDWLEAMSKNFRAMFFNSAPTVSYKPEENVVHDDGTITGVVHGYDADGDALVYKVGKITNGTVVIDSAGNFVYTPSTTSVPVGSASAQTGNTASFVITVAQVRNLSGLMKLFSLGRRSTASTTVSVGTGSATTGGTTTPSTPTTNHGDETKSLQALFDGLKAGDTLTLESRTYQHSGVLKIRVAGVTIIGNGAVLESTNDATSAVQILADNVSVSNLTLTAPLTGTRYDSLDQHKLVIIGDGVTVSDVTVNGSAAAGVFVYGASHFTLNRVTVRNTRADGIHMTNGANNGSVNGAVVESSGDDGIAVVSYADAPTCHDIVVDSPTVNGTTWGRGLSVVGGDDISFRNINVSKTNAAAVYIATESSYNTRSVNNVEIVGGTITGANTNSQVVHGAVLVYSGNSGKSINGVSISGLSIVTTNPSVYWNVGVILDAGTVSNLSFKNIALKSTKLSPLSISAKVPAGTYTVSGWTLDGKAITV
ncbi:MAG: right-handed parallel beta-helix repeat-containing protein [Mycobacterium sp.]|nr:right-handed parallel beta-helix repeat-containing protein [Mycobacterium sp.]